MAKALQHCLGKLIKDCGLDDALVESKAFGPNVIDLVLSGRHYVRSLRGFLLTEDAIEVLKWEAFWKEAGETIKEERENLEYLSLKLADKKSEASVQLLNQC